MANVLPVAAQKKIARLYRARFIFALSAAILVLALVCACALLPSYRALSLATSPLPAAVGERVASEDVIAMSNARSLVQQLQTALASTTSPSAVIGLALAERPTAVRIEHITYIAPQAEKPADLQLVGTASRDRIAAFRDALLANPRFANVAVPVAALVGNASGDFTLTLTVSQL